MAKILVLCAFGFFASLVDAIAGGGGLISVPALFVLFPSLPAPYVLGTNKFASISGASAAVARYAFGKKIVWSAAIPAGIIGFFFAILGAHTVSHLDKAIIRPLIFILLVSVAIYTLLNKELGSVHEPKLDEKRALWIALVLGAASGFYEGFFGPGNGSFLIFAFAGIFGFDFLSASATGRLVNWAGSLGALIYFIAAGLVRYDIAVPMAVSMIVGGAIGARLALKHGGTFIRVLFLIVLAAVLAKFAWDTFHG